MSSINFEKDPNDLNPNSLSANLRQLMQKSGIDSSELSKVTNIALTTINSLKRGIGNPTLSTLQTLADFFGITIGQLTEGVFSDSSLIRNLVEIPLLDMHEIKNPLSFYVNSKTKIALEIEKGNELFAIKITNNSMSPMFEKGTVFVVCQEIQPLDGDIVLVQFCNQLPCFRKIFIEYDSCIFSPVSEVSRLEISNNKKYIIHGVVLKAIQNFHG